MIKLKTANINLGDLMSLAHGDTAKKELARRRLNIVDADINAWSFLINSPYHQVVLK